MAWNELSSNDIHRRDTQLSMDWTELSTILKSHYAKKLQAAGLLVPGAEITFTIKIEQESEGSPPYMVQKWRCYINATQSFITPEPEQDDFKPLDQGYGNAS